MTVRDNSEEAGLAVSPEELVAHARKFQELAGGVKSPCVSGISPTFAVCGTAQVSVGLKRAREQASGNVSVLVEDGRSAATSLLALAKAYQDVERRIVRSLNASGEHSTRQQHTDPAPSVGAGRAPRGTA